MGTKFVDRVGQRYGQLEVMHRVPGSPVKWECLCDCGVAKIVSAANLACGNTQSCGGHRVREAIDRVGERHSRLVVVERAAGRTKSGGALWLCQCDCGKTVTVAAGHLVKGNTKSCGCLRVDQSKVTNRKHGMAGSLAYQRWLSIKQRTTNPKDPSYRNYGARGITMCQDWFASFEAFHDAVGDSPGPGVSLDRIDNDGNYEPGNVRWATHSEQMLNRRPVKRATLNDIAELDVLRRRVAELESALS